MFLVIEWEQPYMFFALWQPSQELLDRLETVSQWDTAFDAITNRYFQ